jgi:hypothetical protein
MSTGLGIPDSFVAANVNRSSLDVLTKLPLLYVRLIALEAWTISNVHPEWPYTWYGVVFLVLTAGGEGTAPVPGRAAMMDMAIMRMRTELPFGRPMKTKEVDIMPRSARGSFGPGCKGLTAVVQLKNKDNPAWTPRGRTTRRGSRRGSGRGRAAGGFVASACVDGNGPDPVEEVVVVELGGFVASACVDGDADPVEEAVVVELQVDWLPAPVLMAMVQIQLRKRSL